MGILSQSLFMEQSDEFTRRLCGVWLSHLGGYFQRWRMIAEVPTLGNEVEPLRLELPLHHFDRAERLEFIPIDPWFGLCFDQILLIDGEDLLHGLPAGNSPFDRLGILLVVE